MGDSYQTDKDSIWAAFFKCDYCGYPNIALMAAYVDDGFDRFDANSVFSKNDGSQPFVWLPDEPLGKEFEDVPQHIADAASEAYACFSIRSYRAAILMARSVLEATAKDKKVTKGNLASKIDELAANGVISEQIKDEAHEIRYLGNDMAHGDFTEPVSEEDADDMLGFLATFLNYVYQTAAGGAQEQACESECLRIPGYETIPSSGVKQSGRGSNRYSQMMGSLQDAGVSIYGSPIPAFQQANGEDGH